MANKFQNINYDINNLPSLPLIATRMVELLNSPTSSATEMAQVISADPSISARVLQIANSSFYSMARQVKTLSTAIVILGEKTLKNLVLAASLRNMQKKFGPPEQLLWEDAMTCALGARFLAHNLKIIDPEEAFIAGLFRHVGRVVFNNQQGAIYAPILLHKPYNERDLCEREKTRFGVEHTTLGAAVLEQWNLSDIISLTSLHHHDENLDALENDETRTLTAIVNLASEFPLLLGLFGKPPATIDLALWPGARTLKIGKEPMAELLENFRRVFAENRDNFLS
jgi:HD-like signal output (HDOD) protein